MRAPLTISSIGSIPEQIPGIPTKGEVYAYIDATSVCSTTALRRCIAAGNVLTGKGNIKDSLESGTYVGIHVAESYLGLNGDDVPLAEGARKEAEHQGERIAEAMKSRPGLGPQQVDEVIRRVRERQRAIGYEGNYRVWITADDAGGSALSRQPGRNGAQSATAAKRNGGKIMDELKQTDPEIYDLIRAEERYEIDSVRLIPSENYVSRAVLEATGSILTNKYSEGYPGRRYYEGQRYVDQIETLVAERAPHAVQRRARQRSALFGIARQILAVYLALLKPGDTLMGLALPHGGHLTHGWPVSTTGMFWSAAHYQVDRESQRIDYDAVRAIWRRRSGRKLSSPADRLSAPVGLQDFRRDRKRSRRASCWPTSRTSRD